MRRWACRPRRFWAVGALSLACLGSVGNGRAATIRVPDEFAGIQAAIDVAQSSDTVLISPGAYTGDLVISGKSLTLASRYILTGDTNDIALTTLTGRSTTLTIDASAGPSTTIRGLTFLHGGYHIENYARRVNILDDHFIGGGDQMSFEGAGGLVRGCRFEGSGDDAVDVDNASDPIIENNIILDSGDDGIELRLHPYTASLLQIVIRHNVISGCKEDGIQLIDYAGASSRDFLIEGNVITNSAKVGLACMADGNTIENFLGAPLVEPVRVIGNTLCGNPVGVTGGDDMLLMNNIIYGCSQVAMKRILTSSFVSHTNLCNNAASWLDSNVDMGTTLWANPRLDVDYTLQGGSPCIDAGAVSLAWNGKKVSADSYLGAAPDLGARESDGGTVVSVPRPARPTGMAIDGVRPNPASNSVAVSFTLRDRSPARLELLDPAGRMVLAQELGALEPGSHAVKLPATRALPAGVYLVRLAQGGRSVAASMVIAR